MFIIKKITTTEYKARNEYEKNIIINHIRKQEKNAQIIIEKILDEEEVI